MTVYNLQQLIKARLYTNLRPRFEFYQTEKRGWFNRIKREAGVYSMLGFHGCTKLDMPPPHTYVADNVLYYYPHIDYTFSDGSVKSRYFENLEDAIKVFDVLLKAYPELENKLINPPNLINVKQNKVYLNMEKPINIKISGGNQVSGTHASPNPKDEMIVNISVMMKISRADFEKYKANKLTVDELTALIENRI